MCFQWWWVHHHTHYHIISNRLIQLFDFLKLTAAVKKAWETKKTPSNEVLSPSRVQRGIGDLLKQLPAVTEEVKPRGRPTGNQMSAEIITRPDCEVVKKSAPKPPPPKD